MSQPHDGSWVDRQIREAQERGEFDNLPGAGKPLPSLDKQDPDWWIKGMVQREQLDMSMALPPALALRKEAAGLVDRVLAEATEQNVREIVGDFNDRVRAALRRPAEGPPIAVSVFDVEEVVARWREHRAGLAVRHAPEPAVPAPGPRSRWHWRTWLRLGSR